MGIGFSFVGLQFKGLRDLRRKVLQQTPKPPARSPESHFILNPKPEAPISLNPKPEVLIPKP